MCRAHELDEVLHSCISVIKDGFHVVTHLIMGGHLSCAVDHGILFLFGEMRETIEDIGVHSQLHRKSDGQFAIVYHVYHPGVSMSRRVYIYTVQMIFAKKVCIEKNVLVL